MNRMAAATVATANGDSVLRSDRDVPLTPRMADSAAHDYSSPQDSITTPTRRSFAGLPGQLPLPKEPLSEQTDVHRRAHSRTASFASSRHTRDLDDIDMDDADMDTAVEDDISGDESVTSERPSKKKKGQRFFCTEFPPCQLSFTRSEHLARHIRKHTGERPFQCHCSRRFSRLDNLRQHAQTVHVNEEIPGDSLAATSTRFQRQIRTDRVKSSGGRSRTSAPSSGGPARGHSRNLSASSVGSTSSFSLAEETRPRPTLAIATGAKRSSGAMEDYNHAESSQHLAQSGLSTPTSQTFAGSPSFTPGYASPASAVSRSSFYNGSRHSRRLSVPTGPNPFQQPMHPASYYTPVSSQASVYSSTSGYGSPTSSIYSPGRRDSETEIEYRRRTWHPTTQTNYSQRPATSGLSYHQTPDEPRPAASQQPAASQVTRLPGIESFDHVAQPASRAPPSPMMLDSRPSTSDRQEAGLHQGFHRLEIAASQLPDSSYQQPPIAAQAYAPTSYSNMLQQPRHQHHISMPEVPMTPRKNKRQAWYGGPIGPSTAVQQSNLAPFRPSPEDSGSSDGAPTPLTFQGQEYHPVIVNHEQPVHPVAEEQEKSQFPSTPTMLPPTSVRTQDYQKPAVPVRADSGFQGYIPSQPTSVPVHRPYDAPPADFYTRYTSTNIDGRSFDHNHDMGRLEALVAVATSENRAVQNQQ